MMRSYVGLFVSLCLCLALAFGCSDSGDSETGGSGGDGGTGGDGGMGGVGGMGGMGGGTAGVTKEKQISLGCANSSPIGFQSILLADLSVTAPDPVTASEEFSATVTGTATFPASFLDAAQPLVQGGLRQAKLNDLRYVVQVRSGATGPDVPLAADASQLTPGEVRLCNFPEDLECTQNSDCVGGICNQPIILVDVPVSEDCASGGVCDMLGKCCTPDSQCGLNGFCVTGDLDVPLTSATQNYTADASGPVLFGWAETGLGNNTYDETTMLYTIPKPNSLAPIEQGLKVDARLVVAIECVMGVDEGDDPANPQNTLVGFTPDADLVSFDVQ